MNKQKNSRREFLKTSGTAFGGSWLSLNLPLVLAAAQTACSRRDAGESWDTLSAAEAAGLGAVADQIIPPDDTPGAVDIGVVYFMDAALGGFMAGLLPMLQEGLATLDEASGGPFAELGFERQTQLLKSMEDSPFFGSMQMLTLWGMFAMPQYGGNREEAGWKLIGFDHRHVWQPPFGYYDERDAQAGDDHVRS